MLELYKSSFYQTQVRMILCFVMRGVVMSIDSKNRINSPTWRTPLTAPCSSSRRPWQKGEFWYSMALLELPLGLEYILMSRSSRGKAQNTSLSWTGSGIRGNLSSIRWNGTVLATNLEAMSRRVPGDCLFSTWWCLFSLVRCLWEQCLLWRWWPETPWSPPRPDIFLITTLVSWTLSYNNITCTNKSPLLAL